MNNSVIILRHLCFTGPDKAPALLAFNVGLNVIYGASETGKSFVLEAIDFMLGGSHELRDIPERIGYDRIYLGIEFNKEEFTFVRATSGGNYQFFNGLHYSLPTDEQHSVLSAKHSVDNENNISNFLLTKIGLNGKLVKTKASGINRNLSFRDLSHLSLIDENRIQKSGSPIETSGQHIHRPVEFSVFKLLLTGVDDSSFVSIAETTSTVQSKNSKIELIDELIDSYNKKLPSPRDSEPDLKDQLEKLENTITSGQPGLNELESSYKESIASRNKIRRRIDEGKSRRSEIDELKARFELLNSHYKSDLERLESMREAGSLIFALEVKSCPLCGALPDHQHPEDNSYGNLEVIVNASNAESQKITRLQSELLETLKQLKNEASGFDRTIPSLKKEEVEIEKIIRDLNSKLIEQKVAFTTLIQKRSDVSSTLSLLDQIKDLKERKTHLETSPLDEPNATQPASATISDLSTTVLDQFAQHVETVLKAWNFPNSDRVQFNESSRDLIISGKRRGSHGKGMRSITHAAFIISLLEFCQNKNLLHTGFLVIDSPLLAYREPEDSDDDLRHTDVQDKFYEYLAQWTNKQIIIIENVTPPDSITSLTSSHMFSKNLSVGRYGFFPPIT